MEHTAERMVIAGSPERCFAVVTEVERYPEWVADLKQVHVLSRDELGRASRYELHPELVEGTAVVIENDVADPAAPLGESSASEGPLPR